MLIVRETLLKKRKKMENDTVKVLNLKTIQCFFLSLQKEYRNTLLSILVFGNRLMKLMTLNLKRIGVKKKFYT